MEGPFRTKQVSLPNLNMNPSPAEKEAKLSDRYLRKDQVQNQNHR